MKVQQSQHYTAAKPQQCHLPPPRHPELRGGSGKQHQSVGRGEYGAQRQQECRGSTAYAWLVQAQQREQRIGEQGEVLHRPRGPVLRDPVGRTEQQHGEQRRQPTARFRGSARQHHQSRRRAQSVANENQRAKIESTQKRGLHIRDCAQCRNAVVYGQ